MMKTEETPVISINRIFRATGIYLFMTLKPWPYLLQKAGFHDMKKESYGTGRDNRLLIDQAYRAVESLYVEVFTRPGMAATGVGP
jgi:hypothetical protein